MSSATATWSTSASMSDRTLGIVGVGLIGGSIGMAARRAGWEVVGVDRAATLERALALGAIDRPADLDGVRGAEMVVLAAPVSQITGLLAELAPTDALVTDVGSTKSAIVRGAAAAGIRRFVGGHPMAGSQLGGVANASADLFQGARYLITPTGDTLPEAYARVTQFVRDDLGAVPTAVDPERHDLMVAALSHLPHLLAVALLQVTSEISPDALALAGPSFRDLTRVGAANPALWADILAENAGAVREVLSSFTEAMRRLDDDVDNRPAIEHHFEGSGAAYKALGGILVEQSGRNADIAVLIENRPRVLAQVTTLMGSADINILDLYMQHSDTHHAALVLTIDAASVERALGLLREAGFHAEVGSPG
ncbi:MAG TPA: prephenate dehydrogenase/arogenate dehydrogenase family protein [Chloroflexi bacterium]|jgi:prephenate dehydrogenase|nr:prephenate dehydrogenase/arogenate dehydrogenase family protein [Chloroflexota bacterium]